MHETNNRQLEIIGFIATSKINVTYKVGFDSSS